MVKDLKITNIHTVYLSRSFLDVRFTVDDKLYRVLVKMGKKKYFVTIVNLSNDVPRSSYFEKFSDGQVLNLLYEVFGLNNSVVEKKYTIILNVIKRTLDSFNNCFVRVYSWIELVVYDGKVYHTFKFDFRDDHVTVTHYAVSMFESETETVKYDELEDVIMRFLKPKSL